MSLAALCNTTVSLDSPSSTSGALGGPVVTWTEQYASIPASLQPLRGDTVERFAKRQVEVDHVAYTPVAVTVAAGWRLRDAAGNAYTVGHAEDQAGRGAVYAIYVKKQD